ncbi:MAG TPA: hypothetical protein VGJ19_17485 [Streptosporangiaceae bacterium]|jgi:hypothetical protein
MRIAPIDSSKLADTNQEFRTLMASDADWIVRSADDLRQLREAGDNPFAKLPDNDFNEFLSSLKFNGGGVSTGHYRPLMASLTLTDIDEVFARFGMSRQLSKETLEAECVNGVCEFSFWSFCSHTCGSDLETQPVTVIEA